MISPLFYAKRAQKCSVVVGAGPQRVTVGTSGQSGGGRTLVSTRVVEVCARRRSRPTRRDTTSGFRHTRPSIVVNSQRSSASPCPRSVGFRSASGPGALRRPAGRRLRRRSGDRSAGVRRRSRTRYDPWRRARTWALLSPCERRPIARTTGATAIDDRTVWPRYRPIRRFAVPIGYHQQAFRHRCRTTSYEPSERSRSGARRSWAGRTTRRNRLEGAREGHAGAVWPTER